MRTAAAVFFFVGRVFLFLTVISSAVAAWRQRDRHRLDITLFLVTLSASPLFNAESLVSGAIRDTLLSSLPYLTLRLLQHLREVRLSLRVAGLIVPAVVGIASLLRPPTSADDLRALIGGYLFLLMAYSALTLGVEAQAHRGLQSRRTALAAVGTLLFAMVFGIGLVARWWPYFSVEYGAPVQRMLNASALVCYFFAFSPPRFLIRFWRRDGQTTYVAEIAEREPEERGRLAPDDLVRGAVRTVGGAITVVALREAPDSNVLVVRASTDRDLIGAMIPPGPTLLNDVFQHGRARMAPPSECVPELATRLDTAGVRVLTAPVSASNTWGVVAVVLRRGALFPDDDLVTLAQLGRSAATALDHAQLIAERREREREAANRRLRQIELRVELMLASITDYAMLVLDERGRVAAWHEGAAHVFGHRAEDMRGASAAPLFDMTEDDLQKMLAEAVARGVAEHEGDYRRRDGTTFIGATTVRPLAGDADEPPGFVAVTQDVTDRRRLEERVRQGQKMEAIGQLAGGVAHDFNNLLTAILGNAEFLDSTLTGDSRREQVTEIQKGAERAAELTRQLLAFSRREMLQPATINLTNLVADLLPLLRRLIGSQIEIVDATSPMVSVVLGDRSQVEQVILNLVVNARDAMPHGGRLTIRTTTVWIDESGAAGGSSGLAPGPHVLLEVSDTGTGMDTPTRERVFEPFFTTKEVGKGTGLGLSTVYGIVQQMRGSVDIESELGRGTTFRLHFPETSEAVVAAHTPARAEAFRGDETVLLVEDDAAVRTYMTHVLESHGYTVIAAEHPKAALSVSRAISEPIDLVISDVVMPGSTGPELVAQLEQSRPELAVLFISGYAESRIARQTGAVSERQLLQKPFSSVDLLTKIRQILASR